MLDNEEIFERSGGANTRRTVMGARWASNTNINGGNIHAWAIDGGSKNTGGQDLWLPTQDKWPRPSSPEWGNWLYSVSSLHTNAKTAGTSCIKESPFKKVEVLVLTKEQITECINSDSTTIKVLDVEKVNAKETLLHSAPVPAYVVYNGLDEAELDAHEVLDHLEYLDGNAAWKVHAKNFVRTTFVSNHRQQ